MTDLITRLEQAEAGSRELDLAVFVAVVGPTDTGLQGLTIEEQIERYPEDLTGIANWWPVPLLTSSLDAITALIGEKLPGAGIDVSIRKGWAAAEVWLDDNEQVSNAKTAPLALACALLRAIKEGEHG